MTPAELERADSAGQAPRIRFIRISETITPPAWDGASTEPGASAARDDGFAAVARDLDDGATSCVDFGRTTAAGRPPSV